MNQFFVNFFCGNQRLRENNLSIKAMQDIVEVIVKKARMMPVSRLSVERLRTTPRALTASLARALLALRSAARRAHTLSSAENGPLHRVQRRRAAVKVCTHSTAKPLPCSGRDAEIALYRVFS